MESSSVIVVGGGLVGLSAALFLARRGVPVVLVERHSGSSAHPRAIGFTPRTLELFRAAGIASRVPEAPAGTGRPRRVKVESLAGKWWPEAEWTPAKSVGTPPPDGYSPSGSAAIAQDRLEPVLRDSAIEFGADVRLSTELVSFEQDSSGVIATLRRRDTAEEYSLRANYLIAADGHTSPIREALGIGRGGHGFMQVVRSVLFRADLEEYLASGISQFELDQPDLKGMLTTYRDGRWLLMFSDDEERDEDTLRKQVIRAVGRSDVSVELITTGRWELSAFIADRFSAGRVFLAGDAAHTLPPARGGYGASTGIEDAFNLAWKLAAVLSGESTPQLLESYDAERRPIAWLRHDQIFARADYASMATAEEQQVPIIEDAAMEWGQLYRSTAVLGAGDELPSALRPPQWAGQPGTRAQHLWVSNDGHRCSTLDLLHHEWVLLTEDPAWRHAAAAAGRTLGLNLHCIMVSDTPEVDVISPPHDLGRLSLDMPIEQIVAVPEGKLALDRNIPTLTTHEMYSTFQMMNLRKLQPLSRGLITDAALDRIAADLATVKYTPPTPDPMGFRAAVRAAFGISSTGCTLVRPDGYIAWRTADMPADATATLTTALRAAASSTARSTETPHTAAEVVPTAKTM
ncbi:FAD-dependent oxidoreductase [Actinoplanes sp. NBRC 103695]|uniref:FAD-dependent oxidoreductase n=1 Tax=Actinoplanes sp. NBRC 103695 TaxID=3032202 RepID=UPI0024A4D04A|nr:FAD-dependent oxidoreductase [Actinoplanes sp. NBRC 103695]GLZ01779.1 hypothetical protein Acsp02_90300 [Actinoplanes sp. NBRC 103695]